MCCRWQHGPGTYCQDRPCWSADPLLLCKVARSACSADDGRWECAEKAATPQGPPLPQGLPQGLWSVDPGPSSMGTVEVAAVGWPGKKGMGWGEPWLALPCQDRERGEPWSQLLLIVRERSQALHHLSSSSLPPPFSFSFLPFVLFRFSLIR